MSIPSPGNAPAAGDAAPSPPATRLEGWLLLGALAALLAGALGAAGSLTELVQGDRPGVTLSLGLNWVGVLAEVGVLLAFLMLAAATGSDALRRSSVGVFGSLWLAQGLALADDSLLPSVPVYIVCGVGLVALVLFTGWKVLDKVSGCGGLGAVVVVAARLFGQNGAEGFLALLLLILAGAILIWVVSMYVWFGATLIRLRDRLGRWSAALGGAELAALAVVTAVVLWALVTVAGAVFDGKDEKELEALLRPPLRLLTIATAPAALLTAVLTAGLFLSVRRLSPASLAPPPAPAAPPADATETGSPDTPQTPPPAETAAHPAPDKPPRTSCPTCAAALEKGAYSCEGCGTIFWDEMGGGLVGALFLLALSGVGLWFFEAFVGRLLSGAVFAVGMLGLVMLVWLIASALWARRKWRNKRSPPPA
jgi:hypothetical protein